MISKRRTGAFRTRFVRYDRRNGPRATRRELARHTSMRIDILNARRSRPNRRLAWFFWRCLLGEPELPLAAWVPLFEAMTIEPEHLLQGAVRYLELRLPEEEDDPSLAARLRAAIRRLSRTVGRLALARLICAARVALAVSEPDDSNGLVVPWEPVALDHRPPALLDPSRAPIRPHAPGRIPAGSPAG